MKALWNITSGQGAVVAIAIHNGHHVRSNIKDHLAITDADRLREEDPFTGLWTDIANSRVIVDISRFQVDLNRSRGKAVYVRPEDAWGLNVWTAEPPQELIDQALQEYDDFYAQMHGMLSELASRSGRIVVFDLHTYNHRREGSEGPPANPEGNPEVNVGTGSLDRNRWAPVVERFMYDLQGYDFMGRHLDVRENVKFRGGHFSQWAHQNFTDSVCVLAIEVKKFFMDEWTGVLDERIFSAVHKALASTVPGVIEELEKLKR